MKWTFSILSLSLFFSSCFFDNDKKVRGDGKVITQSFNNTGFTQVSLGGNMDLFVTQDSGFAVKVEADANLLPHIDIQQKGNVLVIDNKPGVDLQPTNRIKVYVSAPAYTGLNLTGSGVVRTTKRITSSQPLEVQLTGSGDMNIEADASAVSVQSTGSGSIVVNANAPKIDGGMSGSGSITLNGTTRQFVGGNSGSGDIHAYNLLAENAEVDLTGSGDAEVAASQQLTASLTGSGDIYYRGNPKISQSATGSGKVRKAN
jgi:hypothetical protein